MFNVRLRDLFLIPNLISTLRIFLLIPFGFFMSEPGAKGTVMSLSVALLMIVTDFFDGIVARKLNQTSELGKILDPLADKLIFISVSILFVIFRDLPLWIMIYIISRDLTVFTVGTFLSKKSGKIVQSNIWGKLSTAFLSLSFTLILILGVHQPVSSGFLLIALFMFTFSIIGYAVHFVLPIYDESGNKKSRIMVIIFVLFWTTAIIYTICGISGYIIMPEPFSILVMS